MIHFSVQKTLSASWIKVSTPTEMPAGIYWKKLPFQEAYIKKTTVKLNIVTTNQNCQDKVLVNKGDWKIFKLINELWKLGVAMIQAVTQRQNSRGRIEATKNKTRRPASIGILFAQLQKLWSTFANGKKQNYCFDISFPRVFTNINFTTDFCTLWKSVFLRFSVEKFSSHSAEKFCGGTLLCFRKFQGSKNIRDRRGAGITIFRQFCFVSQYRIIS